MLDEEKSWWKKKGFYACACVMLIGVMAIGAVVFRNAKLKNSQKMLAEIEKEIPETRTSEKSADSGEKESLEASAGVTPAPTADAQKEEEETALVAAEEAQKKKEEEAAQREKERQEKIKKAAKKQAKAVSAKIQHKFDAEKGLLWPVEGDILLKYSMDKTVYFKTLAQYKYNPGLFIGAEVGTEVKAAADGKVTEVSKDDDYGMIVKVDLGNDYIITYGQVTDVAVKAGDEVKEGDVIAKVSEPTKYYAEEGTHLYLQVNQGEESVDPLLLLR